MSLKILITGGIGFIGSHLAEKLIAANYSVSVIDNLSTGNKTNLTAKAKFYQKNIQDPSLVDLFKKIQPEIVFHLAAASRVSSSNQGVLNSNIIGTYNVLNCSKAVKVKQVIFTSSAAVYGKSKKFPIKENFPTKPISAYGLSKLTGELYCQFFQSYFTSTILRLANIYGPRQDSSVEGGVVAIFIKNLLQNKKSFIYGDGQQTRDFVYVEDVVKAMLLALKDNKSNIYNLSSNQEISVMNLLQQTAELINKKSDYSFQPFRQGDIKKSLLDNSLIKKQLNWQPQISLKQGLSQTIKYFQSL